jgi:hypothetical protein
MGTFMLEGVNAIGQRGVSAALGSEDSTMTQKTSLLEKARRRLHAALADPRTVTLAGAGKQLLTIAADLGRAGRSPVALVGAVGSAAEVLGRVLDSGDNAIVRYAHAHGFRRLRCEVMGILNRSHLIDHDALTCLVDDRTGSHQRLLVGDLDGARVGFVAYRAEEGEVLAECVWVTGNDDDVLWRFLEHQLWRRLTSPILELRMRAGMYGDQPSLVTAGDTRVDYLDEDRVIAFADDVERYRREGLGRAVMLHGPPGTGKSSFVYSYAHLARSRLLAIGPDALEDIMGGDLLQLCDCLRPEVLLLDDLDKVEDREALHGLLPELRRRHRRLCVVITCNEPRALGASFLRPGRGGELVRFAPPGPAEQRALLAHYLGRAGERTDVIDVEAVASALKPGLTHDWIRDVAEHAHLVEDTEGLLSYVAQANARFAAFNGDPDEGSA